MLKRVLAISFLLCSLLHATSALAGFLYVGPSLTYQSVSTSRSGYNIRYQGISPRLSLGYGDWVRERLFLAGELTSSPKSIDVNNEPKNGQSLKIRYSYGFSVIPGVALDDTIMLFARIGSLRTKFDQLDVTRTGFVAGIGLETTLTCAWSLRAEYDYVKYSSISNIGSPRMDEFAVGGVYRFSF